MATITQARPDTSNFVPVNSVLTNGILGFPESPLKMLSLSELTKIVKTTFGIADNAAGSSVLINSGTRTQVLGITSLAELGTHVGRDVVGSYIGAYPSPYRDYATATYTATSFTVTALDAAFIKPGMIVDTAHSPGWAAFVISVSGDTATTTAWVSIGTGVTGTPASGIGLRLNPNTKVWAANYNVYLSSITQAVSATGIETGVINNKADNLDATGVDVVSLGVNTGGTAYKARHSSAAGQFITAYLAAGARDASFWSNNGNAASGAAIEFLAEGSAGKGFVSRGSGKSSHFQAALAGATVFDVTSNGTIFSAAGFVAQTGLELGGTQNGYVDFHRTDEAASTDYSQRIIAAALDKLEVRFADPNGTFAVAGKLSTTSTITGTAITGTAISGTSLAISTSAAVTGSFTSNTVTTNTMTTSALNFSNAEIGSTTAAVNTRPYLDFHYGKGAGATAEDYNVRVINAADGRLEVLFIAGGQSRTVMGKFLQLAANTPTSSADSSGETGDACWDANYIYARGAAGWKRAALSTW